MESNHSRPIPESYWVLPNRFLAGEYPGSHDENAARRRISAFLETGITDFLDLTKPGELIPYEPILKELASAYGLSAYYTRIPIQDLGLPTRDTMKTILDAIDLALNKDRKIYVHCWGGVGRTGTAVGCYLVRRGMTGERALGQIAEWWKDMPKRIYFPRSPETDAQVEFIRNWREE
jgi:rhodanese-related sulfurtransferase